MVDDKDKKSEEPAKKDDLLKTVTDQATKVAGQATALATSLFGKAMDAFKKATAKKDDKKDDDQQPPAPKQ